MSAIPWMIMAAAGAAIDYVDPLPRLEPGEQPRHHLRMLMENDSPFGSDCNYTHGTRIDYAQNLAKNPHHAFGASLTQNIYTPETHTKGAVPGEHPYAGYLAVGVAHMFIGETIGSSIEFQIGATGKYSFAEDSQDLIHKGFGLDRWEGWHDQIPFEMTFQLTARQDYRLAWLETTTASGLQTDATLFTREELGTVSVAAETGVYFRFGRNLPPAMQVNGNHAATFGVGLIRKPDYDPETMSWYLLAGGSVRYVAHDLFIEGGVFHDYDFGCSREPWVGEATVGFGVRRKGVDYYAGVVTRTPNFHAQVDDTFFATFNIAFHW